ncbi:PTS transporter subunit EIIC [Spiroplasma monobiae]|uniref:PTS system cellobiose-specific IIC component n=1 Tax=Spiroplasma monobiae MQ-1 TaxID=1336748 RepID=A0A2K9LU66_SPISQ|nr:PTS transporter subunit EIIC [Spiroplasma monobiae]AUM62441.1 PTS system cellobiose-specific IIC component [Spiroplasma monobiae MQ-1]
MLKFENYPDIFELIKVVNTDKDRKFKFKKEISDLKSELHNKKLKLKSVSGMFLKIRKEKEKELTASLDVELSNARYKKSDINKLYKDYKLNLSLLKEEYDIKRDNRIQKMKVEIYDIQNKIEQIKTQLLVNKEKTKEDKNKIKELWNIKREEVEQRNELLLSELKVLKNETKENISKYKKEYNEKHKNLINQWKIDNHSLVNVGYILRKLGRKRRLKPINNEIDETIYELSLKVNEIKIDFKNKVQTEKNKVKDKKLIVRYNKGKADPITIKTSVDKITWASGKLSNWKFMVAIKNGFFSLMPLVIVGAMFILVNNIILGAGNGGIFNLFYLTADQLAVLDRLKSIGSYIWNGTYAFFGLLLCGAISYHLAPYYKVNQWAAAIVGIVSFLIMNPSFWGNLGVFGTSGMFTAMIIALASTSIFGRLSKNDKLKIKMPESVPDGVAKSFNVLIPYSITAVFFGLIAFAISWIGSIVGEITVGSNSVTFMDINGLITVAIQKPLVNAVSGFGGMITIVMIWQLLWFMGIHASGILSPIVEPIQLDGLTQNQQALAEGIQPEYVFTNPFMNNFLFMGGTGGTIGLIIAILLFSKRGDYRSMAKVTLIPALFCINEPLLFGLPIVLNPILFIPFVFGPIIAGMIAYFATTTGIMPHSSVVVPWTTPPILGGILTTKSIMGGLVAAVNFVMLISIYTPFVLLANKIEQRELLNKFAQNKNQNLENVVKLNSNLNNLNSTNV